MIDLIKSTWWMIRKWTDDWSDIEWRNERGPDTDWSHHPLASLVEGGVWVNGEWLNYSDWLNKRWSEWWEKRWMTEGWINDGWRELDREGKRAPADDWSHHPLASLVAGVWWVLSSGNDVDSKKIHLMIDISGQTIDVIKLHWIAVEIWFEF